MSRGTKPWACKMGPGDDDGSDVGDGLGTVLELEFLNIGVTAKDSGRPLVPAEGTTVAVSPWAADNILCSVCTFLGVASAFQLVISTIYVLSFRILHPIYRTNDDSDHS
jgi:hypothetical protein